MEANKNYLIALYLADIIISTCISMAWNLSKVPSEIIVNKLKLTIGVCGSTRTFYDTGVIKQCEEISSLPFRLV